MLRSIRLVGLGLATASLIVACSSNAIGAGPALGSAGSGSPEMTSVGTSAIASPVVQSASPLVQSAPADPAPATCPIAKPTDPFVPPPDYPAPARPPSPALAWYGTKRLWTMLDTGGEIWSGLPRGDDGALSQKTFWWSAAFDVNRELQPDIRVEGRRVDGPDTFEVPPPGTNAQADFGSAMLVGIEVPTGGCWRISAIYRDASLSYVVWVTSDG